MRNFTSRIKLVIGLAWLGATGVAFCLLIALQPTGGLLNTDLMALFPAVEKDAHIEEAVHLVQQAADRQVIFLVGHPDPGAAKTYAAKLTVALAGLPGIGTVQARQTGEDEQRWWQLYTPHATQLLSAEVRGLLQDNQGDVWVQRVLAQVYNPFAGVGAGELRADPMLLTRNFLMSLQEFRGRLQLDSGWLVAEGDDGLSYVMLASELAITPYSMSGAKNLAEKMDESIKELEAEQPDLKILRQGTLFYAAHGIGQAQQEISTIGLGSLLGVVLLLWLVFKGLKPLLLSGLSILSGLLFASAATMLVFGNIHIFTLVIGASLIGVSVDYSFHYLSEWLSEKHDWRPLAALQRILPAICMGLVTSILAYLVLLMTPFPGLKQLAVFSSAGLFAAFLTVVLLYPLLLDSLSVAPFPWKVPLNKWLSYIRAPGRALILNGSLLAMVLVALPSLKVNDDIRQLQASPASLQDQGEQIAAIIGTGATQRMLIVRGADDEQVLQKLEMITPGLRKAVAQGTLGGFRSLSTMIPSRQRQESDFILVRDRLVGPWLPALEGKIKLGPFDGGRFYPADFSPLTIDEWLASPASRGLRKLWLGPVGDQPAAVVPLMAVADGLIIQSIASQLDDVYYVSRADELSALFGSYRVKISFLLLASYAVILLLLCYRYGLPRAVRIVWAPFLAGATALAMLAVLGLPLNLFGVLGLVLVLGIGIDYTLFMAECRTKPASTLLAVVLSAVTTLLSFGLLSLSQTAAIQTFGLVVLVGILVAFALSPSACACPPDVTAPEKTREP